MLGILVISFFIPALLATPMVRDGKIIGGTTATTGAYPYQVAILHWFGGMFCGGSILTLNLVLTAAHCNVEITSNFKVLAGSISYTNYYYAYPYGQERDIKDFIKHRQYVNAHSGFDIALVKVKQPFVYSSNVKPINLPQTGLGNSPIYGSVIATGWGSTNVNVNSIPEILQTVTLDVVPYEQCVTKWGALPSNVVCAAAPGKDTCQGDSGGPLVQNQGGLLVQVGITSFGATCADPNKPGVYTSLKDYKDWILYASVFGA